MKTIFVKKTAKLNIEGSPSDDLLVVKNSAFFGVSPSRLTIKPKLLVKIGDFVNVGTLLFYDKKNEVNKFLSPVSGVVEDVVYGDKRSLKKVIIKSDNKFSKDKLFDPLTSDQIKSLDVPDIFNLIQSGGLWHTFTSYPFNMPPLDDQLPPSIYVTLDNDEPFTPQSNVVLQGSEDLFLKGLDVLRRISSNLNIGVAKKSKLNETKILQEATHKIVGDYPANNPGVFLFYNKKTQEENSSWGLNGQDVVRIGQLFDTGEYPNEKIISVAGSMVGAPAHYRVKEGQSLESFVDVASFKEGPRRVICGGMLTGFKVDEDDFVSYKDNAINVIPEGKDQELLHFFKPGFDKPTYGKTYLSFMLKGKKWDMTSSLNGGKRACISCGVCEKVCPVDSAPQMIMKSLKDNDYETAIEYGLLDTVDTGLYTYVCPSKIEIDKIFRDAKQKLYKELTS